MEHWQQPWVDEDKTEAPAISAETRPFGKTDQLGRAKEPARPRPRFGLSESVSLTSLRRATCRPCHATDATSIASSEESVEHDTAPQRNSRDADVAKMVARVYATGPTTTIFQARSAPTSPLRVGQRVSLFSDIGTAFVVSRKIVSMRVPEKNSVDLVLQKVDPKDPVLILNISITLGWIELPAWAAAMHKFFSNALPSTYPEPDVVPAPSTIRPGMRTYWTTGQLC